MSSNAGKTTIFYSKQLRCHGPTTRFIGIFSHKNYDLMASMQRTSVDEEISCSCNYFGQKKRNKKLALYSRISSSWMTEIVNVFKVCSRCTFLAPFSWLFWVQFFDFSLAFFLNQFVHLIKDCKEDHRFISPSSLW